MKQIIICLILIISASNSFAQKRYLEVNKQSNDKTHKIYEGRRVRVKTKEEKIISGRLYIIDSVRVSIHKQIINIQDIIKIKHNPLILNIAIDGFLYTVSAFGIIIGVSTALYGMSGYGPLIGGVSGAYLFQHIARKSPNFLPSYKRKRGYTYKLVL